MKNKAFTIIELVIVVVIISIIASFGIPGFSKTTNRAKARDAMYNLSMIHGANLLYNARYGHNLTAATLASINSVLNLNINDNGATYSCSTGTTCVATGAGSIFVATVTLNTQLSNTNPSCPTGTYTSCP